MEHRADHPLPSGSAPCVCRMLELRVPEAELPEIRRLLGAALLDQCAEMHCEVELWLQIWRDTVCRPPSRFKEPHTSLADPPRIKELLRDEIRLLLLAVQDKASREGSDGVAAVSRYSHDVVRYVMAGDKRQQHDDPQLVLCHQDVRSLSRCQSDMEAMKDKLTMGHIDEVVEHLKSALTEEYQALRREAEFLQVCVEQEFLSQVPEPTLEELRRERRLLEQELSCPSISLRPAELTTSTQHSLKFTQLSAQIPPLDRTIRSSTPNPRHDDQLFSQCGVDLPLHGSGGWSPESSWNLCQESPRIRGLQDRSLSPETVTVAEGKCSSLSLAPVVRAKCPHQPPLGILLPVPPAAHRPTSRRQSSARRLRLLQTDGLVSLT